MIPKIIHIIWTSSNEVNPKFNPFIESWRKCNPKFKIIVWTFNTLELHKYSLDTRRILKSEVNYTVKKDIVMWEILYLYGGIVADIDTMCQKPFDRFLSDNLFIGEVERKKGKKEKLYGPFWEKTNKKGVYKNLNNGIVGSVKSSIVVKKILRTVQKSVIKNWRDCFNGKVFEHCENACFPIMFEKATIYPAYFFNPFAENEIDRRLDKFPDSYSVHHWGHGDVDHWKTQIFGKVVKLCPV